MNFFLTLLIIAVLAALLCGVLIVRRRVPLKPKNLNAPRQWWKRIDREIIAQWSLELLNDLRFISTWGQWRYKTPWILILGDYFAGKSSVAASVKHARQDLLMKERMLAVRAPVSWYFFNGGVLIDPDNTGDNSGNTNEQRGCGKTLDRLNDLRPERPLDGVVLMVSAKVLLSGDAQAIQSVAENSYRQLWMIQKKFEFSFPVYILVTQCDAIDGFEVFWNTQPKSRLDEVMGWSSPYSLDTNFSGEWVGEAFVSIVEALNALQLETAAGNAIDELVARQTNQEDEFFLFPRRFAQLQEPLRNVLKYVLQPSAYHANFYFRGIYFCGVAGECADVVGTRGDVRFVTQLFDEKVFAERNLAQATRVGLWSRKQKVKRIQMVSVAAFVLLCVALFFAALQLGRQKDLFLNTINVVKRDSSTLASQSCPNPQEVYDLLDSISNVKSDWTYASIPASWFDRRIASTSAEYLAYKAFEDVVFPNLQCHLDQKADALRNKKKLEMVGGGAGRVFAAMQKDIVDYASAVLAFEKSYQLFEELNKVTSAERGYEALEQLNRLAQYLYDRPLPKSVYNPKSPLIRALASVHPAKAPAQIDGFRNEAAANILKMLHDMAGERDTRMHAGAELLQRLDRNAPTLLSDTREFTWWLKWIDTDWFDDAGRNNPCNAAYVALAPALSELQKYGYPLMQQNLRGQQNPGGQQNPAGPQNFGEQKNVEGKFDLEVCYEKNMRVLENTSIAPAPSLLTNVNGHRQLAPSSLRELGSLEKLLTLDFMQQPASGEFQCKTPLAGWKPQNLSKATAYIREYLEFAESKGAQTVNAADRPLYDRIAREQLLRVLDNEMMLAQVAVDFSDGPSGDAVDSLDEQISGGSKNFKEAVQPLLFVLRMYKNLGFTQSFNRITQCTRYYATDALANIDYLADMGRLYRPAYIGSGAANEPNGRDGTAEILLYNFGNEAKTETYLDKQFKRVQILGGYAAPYVKFLRDSDALGEASAPNEQSEEYWENTLAQIKQKEQFAATTSQSALLDSFISNQLQGMSKRNCNDRLHAYFTQAVAAENDLFSDRRSFLLQQAQLYCDNYRQAENFTLYQQYAKQFNRVAAGQFPFDSASATDAPIATVRQAVRDYVQDADGIKAYVNQVAPANRSAFQRYIGDMNAVANFMKWNLAADDIQPVALSLQFRARAEDSKGSNQLVSWRLSNGRDDINFPPYRQGDVAQMTWNFGQPLTLELNWAELSDYAPQQDAQQSDMQVDGNKVTFKVSGNWALLRWIALHKPTTGSARNTMSTPVQSYLEFRVPVQLKNEGQLKNGDQAKGEGQRKAEGAHARTQIVYLYIALSASASDPATKKSVEINLPEIFPSNAPVEW